MLIISSVCADFRDRNGNTIHRIKAENLNLFQEAPESIREDPLFNLLVADGSIRFPEDAVSRKNLENNPTAGQTASGKTIEKTQKPEKKTVASDHPGEVPSVKTEEKPKEEKQK